MAYIETPPTMQGLLRAVGRVRAGEDALADLRAEAQRLQDLSAQVAEGLRAEEEVPPEVPEDQRLASAEGRRRFEEGLERLDEGLLLMLVAADEGDPYYMEVGLGHLEAGVSSIASVGAVWVELVRKYGLASGEGSA